MSGCVLLCEDDDALRETWRDALESEGVAIVEARDGDEGLNVAESAAPAVAVVDLIMPRREGIETIAELRRRSPGLRVIAVSGGGALKTDMFLRAAAALGAHETMLKPVDVFTLVRRVKALMA